MAEAGVAMSDAQTFAQKCKECGEDIPYDQARVGGVHMRCETEYYHLKNVRMIKVRPPDCEWCVMTPEEAKAMLDTLTSDEHDDETDTFEFKAQMMSKGEIEALPEFRGW